MAFGLDLSKALVMVLGALAVSCAQVNGAGSSSTNAAEVVTDPGAPKHPVTEQMELETRALANMAPGKISLLDQDGQSHTLASEDSPRPQYVLFIKDGCPCSIEAQPIFNKLAKKFQGKVDFLGIIDVDLVKAKKYATDYKAAFPVLVDPDQKFIGAMKAKASVYNGLLARNGHLVRFWPGYSRDLLAEINETLAKAAGIPATKYDPEYAPVRKTSGCSFEPPKKS